MQQSQALLRTTAVSEKAAKKAAKKTGDLRPILNLRGFCGSIPFAWKLSSILLGIHQGWWMVSLDLKGDYLHVPIHRSHWQYLRFALWNSTGVLVVYQWKCLPFGLVTAPRVFTKVMLPLVAHLHQPYLNDIFHAQASRLQVCLTRDVSLRLHFQTLVCHQPEEVGSHADPSVAPSRRHDRHASRIDISSAGQSGRISASIASAPPHDRRVGSRLHASDGAHGIMPCPRPTMLVPPVTCVDPPGGALRLEGRSAHQADPPPKSSASGCSGVLGRSPENSSRGPSSSSTSHRHPHNGRVGGRVGSRVRSPHDLWCLDGRNDWTPYELSGVDGSLPRLEEIPEYAVWPACPCSDGQHDGDVLPEQGRRDTVQESEPVGSRSNTLVRGASDFSRGSPPRGGGQCATE